MEQSKEKLIRESQGKVRRRRHPEREKLLADYTTSGLTQERFAAQAGVNLGTLRGWLYKQRRRRREVENRFAPVQVEGLSSGAMISPSGTVTLRGPRGGEVEIKAELDGAAVVNLVREFFSLCSR